MAAKKPWEVRWEAVGEWQRNGGQGSVKKVRERNDSSGRLFVLKELLRQDDIERRGRMRREIVALETLLHTSTPRVIDHNTHDYLDRSKKLYAVLELIEGPTLREQITKTAAPYQGVIALTERLLDVLGVYHDVGIGHRDVKPDNILLRNGDIHDPVLIDFGQSFNVIEATDPQVTYEGQQVGNRFLSLPEHSTFSGNKRDLRSDISQCVGVIFYCLTQTEPSVLTDENALLPHQRKPARDRLELLPADSRKEFQALFDHGFRYGLGERFQTIESLRNHISRIRMGGPGEYDHQNTVDRLRARASIRQGNQGIIDALNTVQQRVANCCNQAVAKLGQGYEPSIEIKLTTMDTASTWVRCGVVAALEGSTINTRILIRAVGDEIIIEEIHNPLNQPIDRIPIDAPQSVPSLEENISQRIFTNLDRAFS